MKRRLAAFVVALAFGSHCSLAADDAVVKEVRGAVEVRRGVSEEWNILQAGEYLRPEDTIRTGKNSAARILVEGRQIRIPAQTIVDVSDFRNIGLEEFLLRLAMENILSLPQREESSVSIVPAAEAAEPLEEPELPETPQAPVMEENEPSGTEQAEANEGAMLLQGAKLLYDNAFYATSILQTKETFRLYPALQFDINARMRVAYAFESMRLLNEALTVYSGLLGEQLPTQERAAVQGAIERIRNLQNQH
ncbi:MAG: hypothetical protein L0Y80_06260 [Ignavibacteriae bacterium]|nr:hypothetical protein [Ignavibacteriota bacterium]